jgi:hypothetical protein
LFLGSVSRATDIVQAGGFSANGLKHRFDEILHMSAASPFYMNNSIIELTLCISSIRRKPEYVCSSSSINTTFNPEEKAKSICGARGAVSSI